jgi:hypothetical protein
MSDVLLSSWNSIVCLQGIVKQHSVHFSGEILEVMHYGKIYGYPDGNGLKFSGPVSHVIN